MTVLHSRFFNNTPHISGIIVSESDLSVNGTTFIGNTVCYGAIFSHEIWYPIYTKPFLFDYSIEGLTKFSINENLRGANSSKIMVETTDFANNVCIKGAAAIFINVSSLTVKNSNFTNNFQMSGMTWGADSGAVWAENSIVTIAHTIFINNHANIAGAVYAGNSMLQISTATFINNSALSGVGAIDGGLTDSKITIENTFFYNNTGGECGAAQIGYGRGVMILKTTIFNNNSGAALCFRGNVFYAQNVTFTGNRASWSGGAINVGQGGTIIIHASNFTNNIATDSGGAIYAEHIYQINLTTSTFTRNIALEGSGGAIYSEDTDMLIYSTSFTDNNAADKGGALYAKDNKPWVIIPSIIIMNSTSFYSNGALAGGAIYTAFTGNITVNNSAFLNNTVFTGMHNVESRNGGAFYISGIHNATLINVTFSGNQGMDKGGAIYVEQKAQITLTRALFTHNEVDHGAAIYARDNTILKLDNISFNNNKAYVSGGAIYAMENSHITMENISFNSNIAFRKGGAAYIVNNAVLSLHKTTFKHNALNSDKQSNGGAVYSGGVSTIKLEHVFFDNNTCLGNGGAIYTHRNATVTLQYVGFKENSAGKIEKEHDSIGCGGAIFGAGSATIMLSNTTFYRNTAYKGGSMCGVGRVKLIMFNTSFENNSAQDSGGSIHIAEYTNIVINSATFTANQANSSLSGNDCFHLSTYYHGGGAIYAENNTSILISHTTFNHNTAKYGCLHTLLQVRTRHASGGAIYIRAQESITLIINDTMFYDNTAKTNGGAVYLSKNVTIHLTFVHFTNNSAGNSGAAMHVQESNDVFLYASVFVNNTAMTDTALYIWDVYTLHMVNCILHCMSMKPCIILSGHEEYLNYHTSLISGNTVLHSSSSGFMERAQAEGMIVINSSYHIMEKETIYASGRETF